MHESYIELICVDMRVQRILNQTRLQNIGNAHVTHSCSTITLAVMYAIRDLLKQQRNG